LGGRLKARIIPLLLLSLPAHAAEPLPSTAASVLQMLLGLALTIGCLFAGLYVLKRLQTSRRHNPDNLRIMGSTTLGPKERVVLLAVGKQVLVIGVTPGRISALHTLSLDDLPPPPPQTPEKTTIASDFAMHLKHLLERGREK
jgi:flagellar protein FliO/FliZ